MGRGLTGGGTLVPTGRSYPAYTYWQPYMGCQGAGNQSQYFFLNSPIWVYIWPGVSVCGGWHPNTPKLSNPQSFNHCIFNHWGQTITSNKPKYVLISYCKLFHYHLCSSDTPLQALKMSLLILDES